MTTKESNGSECKLCGDKCSIIIYKAFARSYINKKEAKEDEAIELTNNISEIDKKSNDHLTNETILDAKRKYLKHHYNVDRMNEIKCSNKPCHALTNAESYKHNINHLNELEQAHITFYHRNRFNKHWMNRNRKYRYEYSILSNNDLNEDSDSDSDQGFSQPPMLSYQSSKSNQLKQLSVDMFSEYIHNRNEAVSPNQLQMPSKLKYSKSVRYQKLYVRETKNKRPATGVILFGFEFIVTLKDAVFNNPKEEVLQNRMINNQITVGEWNNLLRSCSRYIKMAKAKAMAFNMKDIVGLKLYTDFDELQRELRKCFRIKNSEKRINVQKNFVHWNNLLVNSSKKAKDDIYKTLYHGVASLDKTSTFNGKYYGPVSTTTVLDVAKQFSGDSGTVLVLHPAYCMCGIRLSWLSNYPDEDEVLYMNITFQITDIIDPKTEKSKLLPIHHHHNELNRIKNALQQISVNSNVLSLNSHHVSSPVIVINDISVLNILYMQYKPKRWDQICDDNQEYAQTLTALRDQFVHLIEKVKAVEMDQTSAVIQHFFSIDPLYYKPPLKSEMEAFHEKFEQNVHYFKLQTVIRLFPEAEEISINAKNWDFTLNEFVKFLTKWRYDYAAVPLKYISIKFDSTKKHQKTCDERAVKELEKHKASANISKLLNLGWKFLTPSTLSRVPFEPPPELPFLLTFTSRNSMIFYRSYTKQILKKASSHRSIEGYDDIKNQDITEIHHNPKICILSTAIWDKIEYKNDLKKMLNKVKLNILTPKGPGGSADDVNESFVNACYDVNSLTLDPLPKALIKIFKPKDVISYQAIYDIFPNTVDIFLRDTQFTLKECQRLCAFLKERGQNNGYIPFERIFYKEQQKTLLKDPLYTLKRSPSMFVFDEDKCDDDITQIHKIAKMLKQSGDWSFQDNGQIAFCNNIWKHHQTKYTFFESEVPGV